MDDSSMKRPRPDHRPSWRDPNMPVMRDYLMGDGSRKTTVDPDYERRYREMLMETSAHPSYDDDPTYDLKKQRKKL
jgi:hypothetical protein